MSWEQVAGRWKQSKGKIRECWGIITNDDTERLEGRREQLDGFLQESFGMIKEIAEKQIREFLRSHPEYSAARQRAANQN